MKRLISAIVFLLTLTSCSSANAVSSNVIDSSDLVCKETVCVNRDSVTDEKDLVYDTVRIFRVSNGLKVTSHSNSAFSHDGSYVVKTDQNLSEKNIQITWMTASGSTEPSKNDEICLANIVITDDEGNVLSEKTVSFIGKAIQNISDALKR